MVTTQAEQLKSHSEAISSAMNVVYKATAGIGAIATFGYLFLINYFPSGLTPGEVVFFAFIALAFSFTYVVVITCGVMSSLWFAHVFGHAYRFTYFRNKDLTNALFEGALSPRFPQLFDRYKWQKTLRQEWREWRFAATRAQLEERDLVPSYLKGRFPLLVSVSLCVFFSLLVYLASITDLTEFAIGCFVAGTMTIFLLRASELNVDTQPSKITKFGFITVLPLVILCIYSGPSLLNVVFEGLGIRARDVSVEIPETETGAIERIGDIIKRPLLDCRRPQSGKVLVHGANILWTGVGEQTLIQFDADDGKKRTLFAPRSSGKAHGRLKLETKSIQILKTVPHIDPCFDLPSDLLFDTGKYSLQSDAPTRIKALVESIKTIGNPSKITIRGHSDPRQIAFAANGLRIDNQLLSERRAAMIADALRSYVKDSEVIILSEGAGSREPKVKCMNEKTASAYEKDQCNKPNRRVEIRIAYRQ